MSLLEHHDTHGAVESLVREADIEIIPLRGVDEKLTGVPAGTTLTITCSAKFGLERTLAYTALAVKAGYRVVPHLAARQVADVAALRDFTGRLDDLGVTGLYVVGGDGPEPVGAYRSAAELLEDLASINHGMTSIGVACYPEGHPAISDASLLEALQRKQPFASYMVSQLCFDHRAITGWLRKVRAAGIALPLHVGLAAPLKTRKLVELSLRIGVGSSIRYLTKQHRFVGNVLPGRSYAPEQLLYQIGDDLSFDELAIERLHLFSFNQIAPTVDWQARITGPATRI